MYKEYRASGFLETISKTTPTDWGNHFNVAERLGLLNQLSLLIDYRWRRMKVVFKEFKINTILDAGCGNGLWVRFLTEQGLKCEGLDYSEQLISSLKNGFPALNWHSGDIRQMPLANDCFDALISWGVIEHDEEGPQKALQEFYRILKPGGVAVISVPFDSAATRNASEFQFPQEKVKRQGGAFFQYYMCLSDLKDFTEKVGFETLTIETFGGPSLALLSPKLYCNAIGKPWFRLLNSVVKLIFFWKPLDHNILSIVRKPH